MLQARAKPTLPWPDSSFTFGSVAASSFSRSASSHGDPLSTITNSPTRGSLSTKPMLSNSAGPVM